MINGKSELILDLIAASREGMSYGTIQRIALAMRTSRPYTRKDRGFWCTNLTGLLHTFCTQDPVTKLYKRNAIDHEGQPYKVIKRVKDEAWANRRALYNLQYGT
jgi:uncharacterized protein YjhX (UPF0386 family)